MTRGEAITAIYGLFNAPHNADINIVYLNKVLDDLCKSQPEPKYVAFMDVPQRKWVGLTTKDVPDKYMGSREFMVGAKWAAKYLKEKNT